MASRIKKVPADSIDSQSQAGDVFIRHGGLEEDPSMLTNIAMLQTAQLTVLAGGMAKTLATSLEYLRQEFNVYPGNTSHPLLISRLKMCAEQAMDTFEEKNERVNNLEEQLQNFPPSVREMLQGSMLNPNVRLEAVRRCLEMVTKRVLITCANKMVEAYNHFGPKVPAPEASGGGGAYGTSPTEASDRGGDM